MKLPPQESDLWETFICDWGGALGKNRARS